MKNVDDIEDELLEDSWVSNASTEESGYFLSPNPVNKSENKLDKYADSLLLSHVKQLQAAITIQSVMRMYLVQKSFRKIFKLIDNSRNDQDVNLLDKMLPADRQDSLPGFRYIDLLSENRNNLVVEYAATIKVEDDVDDDSFASQSSADTQVSSNKQPDHSLDDDDMDTVPVQKGELSILSCLYYSILLITHS